MATSTPMSSVERESISEPPFSIPFPNPTKDMCHGLAQKSPASPPPPPLPIPTHTEDSPSPEDPSSGILPRRHSKTPRPSASTPSQTKHQCIICTEDLPPTSFLEYTPSSQTIPHRCYPHISPLPLPPSYDISPESDINGYDVEAATPVCKPCLSAYLLTQYQTRGADRIQCIQPGCTPWGASHAWKYFAGAFLPPELRDGFNDELVKSLYGRERWVCPAGCGCGGEWTLRPAETWGYPHVECPGCKGRFCDACRSPWHAGKTCQDYQRAGGWQRDGSCLAGDRAKGAVAAGMRNDYLSIREMYRRDARLCPRCQMVILKDGGCSSVHCRQCELWFEWPDAEKVRAPSRREEGLLMRFARKVGGWLGRWRVEAKRRTVGMLQEDCELDMELASSSYSDRSSIASSDSISSREGYHVM